MLSYVVVVQRFVFKFGALFLSLLSFYRPGIIPLFSLFSLLSLSLFCFSFCLATVWRCCVYMLVLCKGVVNYRVVLQV